MEFAIRMLRKHLTNELGWLRLEHKGEKEQKYAIGAELAKKRIPQLEEAIKILGEHNRRSLGNVNGVSVQAPHYQPDPDPAYESPVPGQEKVDDSQLPLF
jgi:hypothetical protein